MTNQYVEVGSKNHNIRKHAGDEEQLGAAGNVSLEETFQGPVSDLGRIGSLLPIPKTLSTKRT